MAFSDEEEASPQENYGGGRQTISIFGCGARFRREILRKRGQRFAARSDQSACVPQWLPR